MVLSLSSVKVGEEGEMPATVQVKVVAARDLPIMDRSSELTDAFVEVCRTFFLLFKPQLLAVAGRQ